MEPKYVLVTNEDVVRPEKDYPFIHIAKMVIRLVAVVLLVLSLVFKYSVVPIYIIIGAFVATFVLGPKQVLMPSPIEIQFYDDYIVAYRPQIRYNYKVSRREILKMRYSDITRCVFKSKVKRLTIYGKLDAQCYNYDRNGILSAEPSYNRVVDDGMIFIPARLSDVDFVSVIEAHSPIRVIVE